MTIDVDYAALEPFYEGQPSGTGLRCLRAVATSEVVVEYAGIALPARVPQVQRVATTPWASRSLTSRVR